MAHASWYTGSATANTWAQDFSALVLKPPVPGGELKLWDAVSKAVDSTTPKFEWTEEPNAAVTATAASGGEGSGALSTTGTSLVLATGQAAASAVRTGSVLIDTADTGVMREQIYVSSVSSETLTVIRNWNATSGSEGTGVAHLASAVYRVLPPVNYEGSARNSTLTTRNRTPRDNYHSIFDVETQISGTDFARVYRGSTPNNWQYQLDGVIRKFARQQEYALLHGKYEARASAAEGSMGGLIYFVEARAGSNLVSTSENFTYTVWDDGMKYLYEQNGEEDLDLVTLVPIAGLQVASAMDASAMRGEYANEQVRGQYATTLLSSVSGKRVPLIGVAHMPADSFMILDLNAVRLHFMMGRGYLMYMNEVGFNLTDAQAARILSEMTLEFHNADTRAYYHYGVTYDRTAV
jgi:hypothetical protein